jgi:NADPH:quinone reductase-like Zn-dependent oxidoreductase
MNAAVIEAFGKPPRYATFNDPAVADGAQLIRVHAAALSNLVKGQASGAHYSSGSQLPFVPGFDGVGTLPDGSRVYFFGPPAPFGAMAERSLAAPSRTIPVPDAVDDVTAAALGNPGLASWGALIGRARLQPGEGVLINGATGVAGQQAIQVAKYLGAKYVVGAAREESMFDKLRSLGADDTISLNQSPEALTAAFRNVLPTVNVVLDYIWGPSAECILTAAQGHGAPEGEPRIRYVQIGAISGDPISLKGQWLRSSGVELLGSGLGSLSAAAIVESLKRMFAAAASNAFRIDTEPTPLSDVESAWNRATPSGCRIVFTT